MGKAFIVWILLRKHVGLSGLKEVPSQCAVAPFVLRWPVHGGLPQRSGATGAYITEDNCYLIGSR